MAPAGGEERTPLHRSTSYNIYRSKTPNPILERHYSDTLDPLKRSRTPLPHEEGSRHRRRTESTWTRGADHRHRAYAYAEIPAKSNIKSTRLKNSPLYTQSSHERWNNLAYDIDSQVRMWTIQEETRRLVAEREAERTRQVQEEVWRIQTKLYLKHSLEKLRLLEERRLAREEEDRERARRQKVAAERSVANAWAIYEQNWAAISSSSGSLSFSSIPWPTLNRPSGPSSITLEAISSFLLSDAHSNSQKPKERIKEALRRWHPDRFVRFLRRVLPEDRAVVEEAVGVVARCLNELMRKYSD